MTGPSRKELWFRIAFSLAGLGLLGATIALRGISNSAALVEVVGIAGLFFGGTAILSAIRLWRSRN